MDKRDVERSFLDFGRVVNQNDDVAVYQNQHQCAEEDGGHQEPLHDLETRGLRNVPANECAEVKSYPSNGPEPHNPVGEYQGDSHSFCYGFLSRASIVISGVRSLLSRTLVSFFLAITSKIQ